MEANTSRVEPMAQVVLGAGVSCLFHPMTYTKVLIQLGYEPLPPVPKTSIFGRKVLAYPSAFKYMSHIKKADGFFGLYRGLGARLVGGFIGSTVSNHVASHLKQVHPASYAEIDDDNEPDDSTVAQLQTLLHETTHEMVSRCAGAIASQPFQVIMLRQMAQFVGKETKYDGIFGSIQEIWEDEGILGFFAGLAPRLVGEALTVWLVNILVHIVDNYFIPKSATSKSMKTYSNAVCTMMVTQLTYPFNLVSNIMSVCDSGLTAGRPQFMPYYSDWRDCFASLYHEGQLKRGASLFWRYYKGPTMLSATGQLMPAKQSYFTY